MQNISITIKLVIYILSISSIWTLGFTLASFYRDYSQETKNLDASLSSVIDSYTPSITNSVYNFDVDQIETQLNGLMAISGLIRVEIKDKEGKTTHFIESEAKYSENMFSILVPEEILTLKTTLEYSSFDRSRSIGTLHYTYTTKAINIGIAERAMVFLGLQFLKTLGLGFVFIFIVHWLITKHIIQTSRYLTTLDPQTEQNIPSILLERSGLKNYEDELDVLASKLNQLTSNLTIVNQQNRDLIIQAEVTAESHKKMAMLAGKLASIGELSGGIAHEINNPIAVIEGYAGMLEHLEGKDENEHKTIKKIYTQIIETIRRVTAITSSMLKYSRQDTKLQLLDIEIILKELESIAISKLKKGSSTLNIKKTEGLKEAYIHGNKVQIGQVFINLINNAVDAMVEHEIDYKQREVTIEIRSEEKEIVALVKNPGPTIPDEIKENVMQPFFTTKPEGKGTGLGLSICRTIMDSHNGSFQLLDTDDGVQFELKFPRPGRTN